MPPTPHAFTDEEALACLKAQMPREAQIQFLAHLMARNVYQGPITAAKLQELWNIGESTFRDIRERANSIRFAAINEVDKELRRETLGTLIQVRDEAMKAYEALMADGSVREAQKFLETANKAAAGLASLLPKQAGDGETEVRLVVEVGSTERPGKE